MMPSEEFEQLGLFSSTYSEPYTVSQLTGYIRRLIDGDPELGDVWLEGEVSNFSQASSGHCYFTLKDAGAQIQCVMWRSDVRRQGYLPADGDQVLSHGRVSVYDARGVYQLYVDQIRRAGVGDLFLQYQRLKSHLEDEGLFAPERKRPLPRFPRCIGVVTSLTAAALRDIVKVLSRRFPLARVLLSPTLVQGDAAPPQIVEALNLLNERDDVDVIIVSRGGGSLEELWAFNDERVARAIASSRLPVICGVGHETDFSLADFAADKRAPTPSAAAELAVPDQAEIRDRIDSWAALLAGALRDTIQERRWRLADLARTLGHLSPATQVMQARQRIDDLVRDAESALAHEARLRRERLDGLLGRLMGLSPEGTLNRGYAIVRNRDTHALVSSVGQVTPGDRLDIRVGDGEFEAEAT
jgi:exodeoxyribonuclease VII large subunit